MAGEAKGLFDLRSFLYSFSIKKLTYCFLFSMICAEKNEDKIFFFLSSFKLFFIVSFTGVKVALISYLKY
jgi:hypothetical protein